MCIEILFRSYGAGLVCVPGSYKHSVPTELKRPLIVGSAPCQLCIHPALLLQLHQHYGSQRLNPVPEILQSQVLVLGVLIIVVVRNRHCDSYGLQAIGYDCQRQTPTRSRQLYYRILRS